MSKKLYRKCPICDADHGSVLCSIEFSPSSDDRLPGAFDVVSCDRCKFVFDDLAITQHDLDEYYAHTIKYQHPDAWGNGGFSAASLERYIEIVEFVRPYLNSSRSFLDIGAGKGGLLYSVKEICGREKQLTAIEPSIPFATEHNGISFYPFFDEIIDKSFYFDFIFCTHVLEHVFNLQGFVENISKVSKEGKYVYIEVPNAAAYIKGYNAPFYYFDREHINHFTLTSIKNLFASYGFEVISSFETQSIGIIFRKIGMKTLNFTCFDNKYSSIIDYIDQSNKLDNIDCYSKIDKFPILCWGMGAHLRRIFLKPNFPKAISAIIDRDRGGRGESWQGIPLVTSDILFDEQYASSTVLITSVLWANEIRQQLLEMNFKGNIINSF